MAALSKVRSNNARRVVVGNWLDRTFGRLRPRRCIVIAVTLILAGLTIPLLMTIGWLPTNFPLGFVGWALSALGGYRLLTRCGEL